MTEAMGILAERLRRAVLLVCVGASAVAAGAQTAGSPYAPLQPLPVGDILLSLPTSHSNAAGTWEVRFSHRFDRSLDQGTGSDRRHSLWGLDGSAAIAIGLSYAPARDLQFSLLRSNALDDVELAAKYVVVQQAEAIPVSLALRGGTDIRTEKNLSDRTSVFAQATVSRRLGPGIEVFAVPSFATNAGRTATSQSSAALFRSAFSIPLGAAWSLRPGLTLAAELIPVNAGLPAKIDAQLGWAVGLKTAIGGHFFEVLLTNSNATHVDQYVTSTYQGAPLRAGDLHLGFNIERRFGGK